MAALIRLQREVQIRTPDYFAKRRSGKFCEHAERLFVCLRCVFTHIKSNLRRSGCRREVDLASLNK